MSLLHASLEMVIRDVLIYQCTQYQLLHLLQFQQYSQVKCIRLGDWSARGNSILLALVVY